MVDRLISFMASGSYIFVFQYPGESYSITKTNPRSTTMSLTLLHASLKLSEHGKPSCLINFHIQAVSRSTSSHWVG